MEILTICLIILCVVCFFVGRYFASKPIEDKNEEIRKQCQILHDKEVKLELRIKDLTDNIKFKEEQVRAADYKIQSIQKQYEEKLKVIENTKQLADEELKQRKKVLEYEFEQYKIKQEEIKQNIQNEIQNIQNNLESLKSTKAAAIEAARKEQEIQENKSFYTLQIPREEKRDIEILEDTKMRISKPRAISMCI
jgi:chromosome segregation ATPase